MSESGFSVRYIRCDRVYIATHERYPGVRLAARRAYAALRGLSYLLAIPLPSNSASERSSNDQP